jgi:hypothetical protein
MAVLNTHKAHTVYTRSLWGDNWVAVPYLYANNFTFAVSPSVNSATLEYSYGRIMRPQSQSFANYTPLSIVDKYVKIAVDGGPTWYGICVDVGDQRDGEKTVNGVDVLTGKQNFICRGLEYLLQRDPITLSYVKDDDQPNGEKAIGRAIGFNLGAGLPGSSVREGNMVGQNAAQGARGAPIFVQNLQDGEEWTSKDIYGYLCEYLIPTDSTGIDRLLWTFNRGANGAYLESHKPTMQIQGKTFFQVMNELVDRRRLLGWYVTVNPQNEFPEIKIFSFNQNLIVLPDNQQIPPNATQVANWDFDNENQVQQAVLATDDAARFHRVIVKGEPPGSVFTVEMPGGGGNAYLETDWTAAQELLYEAGATATAAGALAYNALPQPTDKMDANQSARTKDSLKKVYRYFRVSPTQFTGIIGASAVWPLDRDNTNIPLSFWHPGIRLQDKLPLRLEHDYQNVLAVTNQMKASSKWMYQRPFIFALGETDKYFFLDRAGRGESVGTHIQASGRWWSATLQMQDDAFGIIVDVHGAMQHAIAKNSFAPHDDTDETDYQTDLDYNYLAATVFAECDGYFTVQWPPQNQVVVAADVLKDLIIHAPNCRLDYLVPGTVIDIDAAGAKVLTAGGFVQDDTDYMLNIARSAYEWYSTARKSISVAIHDLAATRTLGELILTIGAGANLVTVNSVVTSASYDLLAGTATYTTQFAELDVL